VPEESLSVGAKVLEMDPQEEADEQHREQDDDGVNPKQWRRRGNVGHRQAIQK
jgi:hypothetical protein